MIRYTLRIKCRGDCIPPYLEADVSKLDFDGKLFAKDLPLPPGVEYLNVVGEEARFDGRKRFLRIP